MNSKNLTLSPHYPVSQDVKDVLCEARKRAAREGFQEVVPDRYVLFVLLAYNRMFSRFDTLLKQVGISPRKLKKRYQSLLPQFQSDIPATDIMERAASYAQEDEGQRDPKVEVDYLLLALLESPDPLLKKLFSEAGLETETLNPAIVKVRENTPLRMVQYVIKEFVEVVVTVLLLVILIKQGFGEFRLIPSESMLPGLQIGDRLVVEKVSHWWRKPQRGDVLVFYPPHPYSILRHDPWSVFLRLTGFSGLIYKKESGIDIAYIKRVVGLPGDVVDVRPGVGVYVNGRLLDEPYIYEVNEDTCTFVHYCGPIVVPEGHYYMMGDNRNHSMDSRFWQFLPEDRIIGRAVFRFWPPGERFGLLTYPAGHFDDQSGKD